MNTVWREALESWTTNLRAAKKPETTIRLRRQHLTQLAHDLPDPWAATFDDLVRWMASHENWQPNTAHAVRSSLRTFYAWAVDTGRIDSSPAGRLPAVKRPDPNPHPLSDDDLARALAYADEREELILDLAIRCGLRRGEIAGLHSRDLVRERDGWSLLVMGKGRKTRIVALADDMADRLLARGRGYIFPGRKGGHLSPEWVGTMISRMLPEGVTLHHGRHRFATDLNEETHDLLLVQQALGHASVSTTQVYVKASSSAMRRAIQSLGRAS